MIISFNDEIKFPLFRFNKMINTENNNREAIYLRFLYNENIEQTLNSFIINNTILKIKVFDDFNTVIFNSEKEYFAQQTDRDLGPNSNQIVLILKEIQHFINNE